MQLLQCSKAPSSVNFIDVSVSFFSVFVCFFVLVSSEILTLLKVVV